VVRTSFEDRCSYQSITRNAANARIPQKAKVVMTMTRLRMITWVAYLSAPELAKGVLREWRWA
jgi:hypothetical protein